MAEGSDAGEEPPSLYVDLDGTLVATDLLRRACLQLAFRRPTEMLLSIPALLRGRAAFKRRVAQGVDFDPAGLPYRREVIEVIRHARERGARAVLATASDALFAERVADHLGLFDAVLASDGELNLKGRKKLEAILRDADSAFDYVGDSKADLSIWSHARRAIVVAPSRGTLRAAAAVAGQVDLLVPRPSRLGALMRVLRLRG